MRYTRFPAICRAWRRLRSISLRDLEHRHYRRPLIGHGYGYLKKSIIIIHNFVFFGAFVDMREYREERQISADKLRLVFKFVNNSVCERGTRRPQGA